MLYPRAHNLDRRRKIQVVCIGIIGVFLFFVWRAPTWLEQFALSIASPFLRTQSAAVEGVKDAQTILSQSKQDLIEENRVLREENQTLRIRAARYEDVLSRYEDLRDTIGDSGRMLRTARVVATPAFSSYDTLILDVGSKDGVRIGTKIFSAGGDVLLGAVEEVTNGTARVALLSGPKRITSGMLFEAEAPVSVEGTGAGGFTARVPKGVPTKPGDRIESLETGALVAVVVETRVEDADGFQTVFATSPVNVFELRHVLVDTTSSVVGQ